MTPADRAPLALGYFADGPWAHQALDRIRATEALRVAFIVARYTAPDPILRQAAADLGVPFFSVPNVNDPAFLEEIGALGADLHVSMSFDQILRADLLALAPMGFINCHAGALPFYRGRNVLNWALINGATSFGVTVHYIDAGIDTGDVILQRLVPITPDDTYATVLEKAIGVCADTLHTALLQLHDGTATRTPQAPAHPVGFYCSRRGEGDEWMDWQWESVRVHNFVRALTSPGPGARTLWKGQPLVLLQARLIPDAPAYIDRPGTVVGRTGEGVVVKTGDTTVLVSEVADLDATGQMVNRRRPRHRIGTVFGLSPGRTLNALLARIEALEKALHG